jgi:RNA polymerase sigma-70 factor (ECF subfamily)
VSDERAHFEALFRDTRAALLDYLARRAAADDAGDLLAEVYLVAWRRRADLPAGDERRLWLYGVAQRVVAEHRRRTWRRIEAEAGAPPPGDRPAADEERGAAVRQALESLSALDRELVTLTAWEELTPAEAARVVGITANNARVRLHRIRSRLARHPRLQALLTSDEGADDEAPVAAEASTSP